MFEIDIIDDEGFKRDIFRRKNYGDALFNLIATSDNLVIALDGKWGTGKTVFVKQWASDLCKLQYSTIYIDAFANDYISEPFIAIAGEIANIAKQADIDKGFDSDKFEKSLLAVLKTAANQYISHLSGIDAININEERKAQNPLYEMIMNKAKYDKEINDFKQILSELPKTINQGYPLVIIIDELDRCRPTFALGILEVIKHFFSVKHIHFILVGNWEQMQSMVKCVYGNEINAEKYLQKFYSFIFTLPVTHDHISTYCRYIVGKLNDSTTTTIYDYVCDLINRPDMDFRTAGKILHTFSISMTYSRDYECLLLYSMLVFLKYHQPNLFNKIIEQKSISDENVRQFLRPDILVNKFGSSIEEVSANIKELISKIWTRNYQDITIMACSISLH